MTPIQGTLSATGVAVFDFNSINLDTFQSINGSGPLPVAFLSRGDIAVNGTIDLSASGGFGFRGGPGGFDGGNFGPASDFGLAVAGARVALYQLPAAALRPTND